MKSDYIIIILLIAIMALVFGFNRSLTNMADNHDAQIKAMGDSIIAMQVQRQQDSIRFVSLMASIDSIKSVKQKYKVIYEQKVDSVRSGSITVADSIIWSIIR